MSNVRVFWIIWCCFWALAWLAAGFVFFLVGGFLLWLAVPVSLGCILLPVGQPPRQLPPPPCLRCGYPWSHHYGGQCPVRQAPPLHLEG